MNVIFLEPGFPSNQREFVRALHSVGAFVIGVGDRPYEWLDDELKGWLGAYQQIASVTDEGALEWAVRHFQSQMWIDRLEAVIEAHVMPAAHVRERCGIPGISARTAYLCRDKVAMKEVLRQAGVPTAASAGISSVREAVAFVEAVGFPVILKPRAAAGASGTYRADTAGRARGGGAGERAGRRRAGGDRGVRGGARGLLRHADRRRARHPRLRQPLLPQRARGDAHALGLAADRGDEPHGRGGLRRGEGDGPAGERAPSASHGADAHGVVLRAEGPALLRDRLPAAGGGAVGQLLRRQRDRPLPRMGDGGLLRDHRPRGRRGAMPAASSPCAPTTTGASRATREPRGSSGSMATTWWGATSPTRGRRPSRWRRATWRTPGCGCAIPTTTRCARS